MPYGNNFGEGWRMNSQNQGPTNSGPLPPDMFPRPWGFDPNNPWGGQQGQGQGQWQDRWQQMNQGGVVPPYLQGRLQNSDWLANHPRIAERMNQGQMPQTGGPGPLPGMPNMFNPEQGQQPQMGQAPQTGSAMPPTNSAPMQGNERMNGFGSLGRTVAAIRGASDKYPRWGQP